METEPVYLATQHRHGPCRDNRVQAQLQHTRRPASAREEADDRKQPEGSKGASVARVLPAEPPASISWDGFVRSTSPRACGNSNTNEQ